MRAALRPSRSSQLRIRRDLRASVREVRKEGRYRVVSSHRSSGTSNSLEPQCVSEPVRDGGFQLLDLVHEEEDPEAAATDCRKVSTMLSALLPKAVIKGMHTVSLRMDDPP